MPHTPVRPHQDMLARITREITATEDLQAVLSSVATALATQPDMIFARVWLYLSDDRCDWCRSHGQTANALVAPGVPGLHLCASAGAVTALDRPHHLVPLEASSAPAIAAVTRRPIRTADILADASFGTAIPTAVSGVGDPFMTADCGRLYFSAVGSVVYVQQ